MTTPILKKVDSNDSLARQREKINSNFSRCGAGSLATGFVAENFNADIDVDYNETTRKVTLIGTFKAYHEGILIPELVSGWESIAHDTGTDTYFLRYDGTQFLFNNTPFNIEKDTLIAVVQYGILKICLREVHGTMDGFTHWQMHYEVGTGRKPNGALFSNYVPNSTTAADRRPFINGVVLTDEDLHTEVEPLNTNSYAQRYLTGSTALGTRSFLTAQTDIVKLSGNQPYYNQWTGSAWTDTLFPNNDYGAIFVVAIPAAKNAHSQSVRYMFCQPQKTSGSLSVIQAITSNDFIYGESTSLLAEYNFIGKIIIRYTASNWSITSIEELSGNKIQQSSGMVGYGLATTITDGLMSSTDFNRLADASAVNGYVKCNGSGDYSAGAVATPTVDGLMPSAYAGGQIAFPATQNPSSDVNTLDDYDEGTYLPTDNSGAGLTFTAVNSGGYVKVGKIVTCSFDITFPVTSNTAFINLGLPFNAGGAVVVGTIGYCNYGGALVFHNNNIYTSAGIALRNVDMSGKRISASITYIASA